ATDRPPLHPAATPSKCEINGAWPSLTDLWAYANDVTLDFSRPGKPTDNGFIEAFNSKLRSECLNAHRFMSLADAQEKLEGWRRHFNEDRPHSAIGYNVPIALHYPDDVTSPSS
ncbi:integrase core domain-containing protein, partial [Primorskyibacter sp. 2E233]|uniref:integrase core domain-containing protein n=1 Tax=Primorskyibacter sp. 2E233 TaxID=3413431 RepID=UPI003BF2030B